MTMFSILNVQTLKHKHEFFKLLEVSPNIRKKKQGFASTKAGSGLWLYSGCWQAALLYDFQLFVVSNIILSNFWRPSLRLLDVGWLFAPSRQKLHPSSAPSLYIRSLLACPPPPANSAQNGARSLARSRSHFSHTDSDQVVGDIWRRRRRGRNKNLSLTLSPPNRHKSCFKHKKMDLQEDSSTVWGGGRDGGKESLRRPPECIKRYCKKPGEGGT